MKKIILDTPYHLSLLAELGKPLTLQPQVCHCIDALYESLFSVVVNEELEQEPISVKTRIYKNNKNGIWRGRIFKKNQKVVVLDIIRAGISPSQRFYLKLTEILNPRFVRQDHIMSQRIETENGVKGSKLSGTKIGGSIRNAILFIPDPMGATGGSIEEVIHFYLDHYGKPKKVVIINLVVTPEFIKRCEKIKIPISVYATRMDKGLTQNGFIYPGLGGLGEIFNNTA